MSFQNIRRVPDVDNFISDLAKRLARAEAQHHESDDTDFIRLVRQDFDRIDMTGNYYSTNLMPRTSIFRLPMEPDGDKLRLWLRFNEPFIHSKDSSGFENDSIEVGEPVYVGGKRELGLCVKMDGINDFFHVVDNDFIRINNMPFNPSVGVFDPDSFDDQFDHNQMATEGKQFSVAAWISPTDLSPTGSDIHQPRVLAGKTDDFFNGWKIAIFPQGSIVFTVNDDGKYHSTTYVNAIDNEALNQDIWYLIVCVYDFADTIPRVYVNGNVSTTSATQHLRLNEPTRTMALRIGAEDTPSMGGLYSGMMDDFRFYRLLSLSQSQVTNLYNNLYTISNILPGEVPIIGYNWYFSKQPSFTRISFAIRSFTTEEIISFPQYFYDDFGITGGYVLSTNGAVDPTRKWQAVDVGNGTCGIVADSDVFYINPLPSSASNQIHIGNVKSYKSNNSLYKSRPFSLAFNGTSQYVSLPYNAITSPVFTTALTVEAWVYIVPSANVYHTIVSGINNTWWSNYLMVNPTGAILFAIAKDDLSSVAHTASGLGTLNGVWHHVVAVYDGSVPNVKIYLDGTQVYSAASTGTVTLYNYIGGEPMDFGVWGIGHTPDNYLNGNIKDIRLHNVALTPTEIGYSSSGDIIKRGLRSRWIFDEGVGVLAKDSIGVLHGTLTNSPIWSGMIPLDVDSVYQNASISVDIKTNAQTRTGSTINDYEMAHLIWRYTDTSHYYYFLFMTTGWEFGKCDGSTTRTRLDSSSVPYALIGQYNTWAIIQNFQNIQVRIDGRLLVDYDDTTQSSQLAGAGTINMYSQDANGEYDNFYIRPLTST